jgi:hypothetical protein
VASDSSIYTKTRSKYGNALLGKQLVIRTDVCNSFPPLVLMAPARRPCEVEQQWQTAVGKRTLTCIMSNCAKSHSMYMWVVIQVGLHTPCRSPALCFGLLGDQSTSRLLYIADDTGDHHQSNAWFVSKPESWGKVSFSDTVESWAGPSISSRIPNQIDNRFLKTMETLPRWENAVFRRTQAWTFESLSIDYCSTCLLDSHD